MRKTLVVVMVALIASALAFGQTTVKADQGKPGTQGPWPVSISGGSVVITLGDAGITVNVNFDGGFIGTTSTQPCTRIVSTNDAGYGTTPSRVPASGPAAGRSWIRICNSLLNSSSTQCICATDSCPSTVAASTQGDLLATADCATYPLGVADSGVPCCVCNGAGSYLPSMECVP